MAKASEKTRKADDIDEELKTTVPRPVGMGRLIA